MQQSPEKRGGFRAYIDNLSHFSRNAMMVLIYSTVTGLVFGVLRLLMNFYILSLGGYTEKFVGNLTSISSAAALLMALPAVYLADRFAHKKIFMSTALISTLSVAGLVLLPFRWSLILFSMTNGIAQSTRQVAIAPFLMANTSDRERQYVFSFNFGMLTLAQFMGNLIGGVLPTWLGGFFDAAPTSTLAYQLALGSMTIIALGGISPLWFITGGQVIDKNSIEMPWTKIGRHGKSLLKFITPQFIIGMGAGMMMPFMNLYYRNVFELSDGSIGLLFAVGGLGMAVAQFAAPPIAERFGKINTVMLTQALSIPFLTMLGIAAWLVPAGRGSYTLLLTLAGLAYFFRLALMNMSGPVYQTFILENIAEDGQALASALNGIAFQFGWVVSPSISGFLQAEYGDFGFVPVFFSVVGFYILGITSQWIFFGRPKARAQRAAALEASAAPMK